MLALLVAHPQYIQATCATSGDGLYEGLDWLAQQLKNSR
jgi:hypothetical protein